MTMFRKERFRLPITFFLICTVLLPILYNDTLYKLLPLTTHLSQSRLPPPPPVNRSAYQAHTHCIIYDRPVRTGSTTIVAGLKACLKERKFRIPKGYPKDGKAGLRMIPKLLPLVGDRVALAGGHIRISQQDVHDVRDKCEKLFYITSCAPMRTRMWSSAKRHMAAQNISMNVVELRDRMVVETEYEDAREAYPFVDRNNIPLDMEEKLLPDYVVRREFMNEDMQNLLGKLGCDTTFKSYNVHADVPRMERLVEQVVLKHEDRAYRWLMKRAEWNLQGLKKLNDFR